MALRGETIGTAYVRILADGSGLDNSVKSEIDKADPAFQHAGNRSSKSFKKGWQDEMDRHPMWRDIEKELLQSAGRGQAVGDFLASGFMKKFEERIKKHWGDEVGSVMVRELRESILSRQSIDVIDDFAKTAGQKAVAAVKEIQAAEELQRKEMERTRTTTDRNRHSLEKFADVVGKAFGRGSRNNFLNWSGSVARGLAMIPVKMVEAGQSVFDFGKKFIATFESARNEAGFASASLQAFQQTTGGLTSVLSTGVAGLAVFAGALDLIIVFAGTAVSAVSSLVGILAALASTIAFGVVGALAPLAGLLVPIGAAIGGIALAFTALDDATRKSLKQTFTPLKNALKDIGEQVRKGLFANLPEQVKRFRALFDSKPAEEFARRVGRALSSIADSFLEVVESPAFKRFAEVMSVQIPQQLRRMGKIFANVMQGLFGIFRALEPVTNRFLTWVSGVTDEFANWANSRKGISEMKDFFDRAAESAKSLGGFLKGAWDVLWAIINAGQGTGNTIVDNMANALERAAKWLSSPEGQKALKQWYQDALNLADQIGKVAKALIRFIDELDSPANRKKAQEFFGAIAKVINFIADHWGQINWLIQHTPLVWLIRNTIRFIKWIIEAYNWTKKWADKTWTWLREAWDKVRTKVADVLGSIRDRLNSLDDKVGAVGTFIKERFSNAWQAVRDAAGRAASWIADRFRGLWGSLRDGVSGAVSAMKDRLGDVVSFVRDMPGKVADLASRFLSAGKTLGHNIIEGLRQGLSDVGGMAADIAQAVKDAINSLLGLPREIGFTIAGKHVGATIPAFAQGGIAMGPQLAMIGESGPEAVVPLSQPLSLVDPAVRQLSALARGQAMANLGGTPGKSVDVGGITIVTPTQDPAAVAQEVVNRMVASTYF